MTSLTLVSSRATRAALATPAAITDVAKLSTGQIAALTAAQVANLSEQNIRALSNTQIAALSKSAVGGLSGSQVALLSPSQVSAFKTTQIPGFTKEGAAGFSAEGIRALSAQQIGSLSAAAVSGLTGSAVGALSTQQVGAIAATAVPSLAPSTLNAFTSEQFNAFTPSQTGALTAAQLNGLNESKFGALKVAALKPTQLAGLSGAAASKLSTQQLGALSAAQVGALSDAAASALTTAQIASLSTAQLNTIKSVTIGNSDGLQIKLSFATSTAKAPSDFRKSAIAAAKSFTDTYSNRAVINIQVGFGETNGRAVSSSAVAQSSSAGAYFNYAAVRTALLQNAGDSEDQQSADATLAANDPTNGGRFLVSTAEQKVLGLAANTGSGIDGYIGLSRTLPIDYTHSGASGKFDALGALQHEISEVLGRTGSVGRAFGPKVYTPLDLFRYKDTAQGPQRALSAGGGGNDYFSIDGGRTRLATYNSTSGGDDYADLTATDGDAYGFGVAGQKSKLTSADVLSLAVLGYNLTAAGKDAVKGLNASLLA